MIKILIFFSYFIFFSEQDLMFLEKKDRKEFGQQGYIKRNSL